MRHTLIAAVLFFSWVPLALAAESATQPSADKIVAAAVAGEQWIHQVKTFYARFEGQGTTSPQHIALRTKELKKQFPTTQVDEAHFPELHAKHSQAITYALDHKRFYRSVSTPQDYQQTVFFDGERAWAYQLFTSNADNGSYSISNDPKPLGDAFWIYLSWLRLGEHPFWFDEQSQRSGYSWDSKMRYIVAGKEKYRGADCWIVEKEFGWERYYIGVDQPHVYAFIMYGEGPSPRAEKSSTVNRVASAKEVALRHGKTVATMDEFDKWRCIGRSDDEQLDLKEEYSRALLKRSAIITTEFYCQDFKEVSPGCFFPMTQGIVSYECDESGEHNPVSDERIFKAAEVKVDQPLPDDLFHMEFAEGARVSDRSHDPPLIYKHKKNFAPGEWQAILDKAAKDQKFWDDQKKAQDAIIGKPAPAFSDKSEWINGKAITWADLKGKVVIVDFFADWCAPCRNDLPTSSQLHKNRAENGFIILGIHPPGSKRESIDKLIKEFDLQYPICIDTPPPRNVQSWGALYAAYGVKAIPHAVLVDQNGNVAAQGSLNQMIARARGLENKP